MRYMKVILYMSISYPHMQVVFNQAQISVFSYEQAIAVTEAQRSALSPVQQTALSMVLNLLEDKPVDFRGTCCFSLSYNRNVLMILTLVYVKIEVFLMSVSTGRSLGVTAEVCLSCHVCSLLVFVLTLLLNSQP